MSRLQSNAITSYLIFLTAGKAVPRKAGFAHRTRCSEIWTASVTDLNTVGGINHSY